MYTLEVVHLVESFSVDGIIPSGSAFQNSTAPSAVIANVVCRQSESYTINTADLAHTSFVTVVKHRRLVKRVSSRQAAKVEFYSRPIPSDHPPRSVSITIIMYRLATLNEGAVYSQTKTHDICMQYTRRTNIIVKHRE